MHKRWLSYLANSLLVSLALLQSCTQRPVPQPPPAAETSGAVTQSVEETDEDLLAKPAPQLADKKAETLPATAPTEAPPESVVRPPEVDTVANGLKYDTVVVQRPPLVQGSAGWQYRRNLRGQIVGFEFSNRGGNRILPERHDIGKNKHYTRDFQFRFDDRARQDIHLSVADWAPSRDKQFRLSGLMNSIWLFFPRVFVPAITAIETRSVVTLPTGEKVEFDSKTHVIVGGVLVEAPVALDAARFPALDYVGKGVTVRADARGNDPRIGTMATISTGSPDPNCANDQRCSQCQVPAKELWEQKGAVRFKFSNDAEFDRYLRARCGLALPPPTANVLFASSPDDSNN